MSWSQFLPSLQADSKEEFDEYLRVEASTTPKEIIERSSAFLDRWPRSQLAARIHEIRFFAYRDQGDSEQARAAGENALRTAPDNLTVKSALAVLLAPKEPEHAASLAQDALRSLDSFRVPRNVTPDRWAKLAGAIRSEAHMALGIVRFQQGDMAGAISALEAADRSTITPNGAVCLRLGRLYAAAGRNADARRLFERAIQAGDDAAAALARRDLEALR
jgi:tetratricopeptide (TPR) repeat protein